MKKIFKPLLALGLIGLFAISCAKNDDFSVPSIDCVETDVKANYSLQDFVTNIPKQMGQYEQDHIISGYVVSNSIAGNFYRQLFIVDQNNENPVLFSADISNSYVTYPVGTKVFIKVKGTYAVLNNGVATIGAENGTRPFPNYLGSPTYTKYIVKSCERLTTSDLDQLPLNVTLDQAIDPKNIGKLITISDVQFGPESRNQMFYNEDNKAGTSEATNNIIQGKESSAVVIFRAAKQANGFANEIVPDNSGTMTGIMTMFNTDFQFVPRSMDDLKLDQPTFDVNPGPGPGKVEGLDKDGVDIKQPNFAANFTDWDNFVLTTNKYGIPDYANSAPTRGPEGQGAMWVYGTPPGNAYLFTTENQTVVKGATAIKMKIKGTAAKSLSFNVYETSGKLRTFNLRTDEQIENKEKVVIKKSITIKTTERVDANGNYQNDYIDATIATDNEWIDISLDLTGIDYNTTAKGNLFAIKVGSNSMYDLFISNVEFVGGTVDPTDPVDPTPGNETNATNFGDWDMFLSNLTSNGIKHIAPSNEKGPNGESTAVIKLNEEGATGNDFLFTIKAGKIPAGKTKITFYIKGTSGKSLSFNLYNKEIANGFVPYNLGTAKFENGSYTINADKNNQYIGTIDTQGKWSKVTITTNEKEPVPLIYNTTADSSLLAVKIGSKNPYDILLTDFIFE